MMTLYMAIVACYCHIYQINGEVRYLLQLATALGPHKILSLNPENDPKKLSYFAKGGFVFVFVLENYNLILLDQRSASFFFK